MWWCDSGQRVVGFLDHSEATLHSAGDRVRRACRQIGVAAGVESFRLAAHVQIDSTFHDENKTLRGRRAEVTANFEFRCVLGECRAHRRPGVDNRGAVFHAWQHRAYKCVGRQQKIIRLLGASCIAEVMHGASLMEEIGNRMMKRADREDAIRSRSLSPRREHRQTPRDRG